LLAHQALFLENKQATTTTWQLSVRELSEAQLPTIYQSLVCG
jgi:hypothetical protein